MIPATIYSRVGMIDAFLLALFMCFLIILSKHDQQWQFPVIFCFITTANGELLEFSEESNTERSDINITSAKD